jgi:integrase/recombinase XerC
LCFARFCQSSGLRLAEVMAMDLFDWVAWQTEGSRPRSGTVVAMVRHAGAAPASVNRRVAAVRALFEYLVMCGDRPDNPVPAPRRGQGLRVKSRGVLGHLGPGRPRAGGRLVRGPRRLPESLDRDEIGAFLADLLTHRDRAIAMLMLLGGLRAGEVRRLLLADVDVALRRVRVVGKGGRERVVPVDRAFFIELTAYLRAERPAGLATPECFVVLVGPTAGQPLTGWAAQCVPPSQRHLWCCPGPAAPAPPHLRHRARRGRDRPVGAAGSDGTYQSGDHRGLCAPVGGASRGRVRRRPSQLVVLEEHAMTAAVARLATDQDHRLVDGYARYCQSLIDAGVMTDRARRDRLRLAR